MAAIDKLEIETSKLLKDIGTLTEYLGGLRKQGEDMMAGINAMSSMWEGEAKNAFTEQFKTDYEILQNYADEIEALIENLQDACTQYDKCESEVGSLISAIRV